MNIRWLVLLCLLMPAVALASGKSVEASMIVTGTIKVNPDGSVNSYTLDKQDKLQAGVVGLISKSIAKWKFEPVRFNGKPALAQTRMSLRIVAHQTSFQHFLASIKGVAFGNDPEQAEKSSQCAHNACLWYKTSIPPDYPSELEQDGVSGTVYLQVEVDRLGRVAKAAVQQVDLHVSPSNFEGELNHWRRLLGEASLAAVRDWTFKIPKTGPDADQDHWIAAVPINYSLVFNGQVIGRPSYGQWDTYIPGPVHKIAWLDNDDQRTAANGSPDAIPDNGQPFVADTRFVLLTPIGNASSKRWPAG